MVCTTYLIAIFGTFATASASRLLWSSTPASYGPYSSGTYLLKTGYPVGNGKLGVVPFGPPGAEKLNLNVDSLWSGGPFENLDYKGGNPSNPLFQALPSIRANIFKNGIGDVNKLLGTQNNYGSSRVLGNLTVTISSLKTWSSYKRSLDLATGVHLTQFTSGNFTYESSIFCSYPHQVCVYALESDGQLPQVTINLENQLSPVDLINNTCNLNGSIHLTGYTQRSPTLGMKYDAVAKAGSQNGTVVGNCSAGGFTIIPSAYQRNIFVVISAGTNYDPTKGNESNQYSFQGEDPERIVREQADAAASTPIQTLVDAHERDYQSLEDSFQLNLPDVAGSSSIETSKLISGYSWNGEGDPYLEARLFELSRHLLISSSRSNSLPANLQGRWTELLTPSWGADYHANINLQMNYWAADQTGLSETQLALWNYIQNTWVPRGSETAQLLYNASGWVTHNEMNIFGHTAMKSSAQWANYPVAAAWMMQHVWDNYDYTRDVKWLETQGYPLIKGVAQFWVSQLQEDVFSMDGSLVVNPCNSPEQGPTTFGCTHYQQLIHEVFQALLKGARIVGDEDEAFIQTVSTSLAKLDKGLHISSWGGIKEWKLPESYGWDTVNNTHRHLSHLTGWHPGYSISSYANGYSNSTIQAAVRTSLISRGLGTGPDADAGWEKVWRGACWARLNDSTMAYEELRYAIDTNFANNGLSMYTALKAPFQIDANFGLAGAILSMLVVDLPLPHDLASNNTERTVVLGPAIPSRWGGGSVKGLRLRGGTSVDFSWDAQGIVNKAELQKLQNNAAEQLRIINVRGERLI